MRAVRVALRVADPLIAAGLARYLEDRPEVVLLDGDQQQPADVVAVAADRLTPDVVDVLRDEAAGRGAPVLLIVTHLVDAELLTAMECQVSAVLSRGSVTPDSLVQGLLTAARGGGVMPLDLLGGLLGQAHGPQRATSPAVAAGLTQREIDVLRLMADGLNTDEIASRLSCSENTVRSVVQGFTRRRKLRSRTHAVAYALRAGVI